MQRNRRLAAYIIIALALLGVSLIVPAAWATSAQRGLGQTVPTRTPTRPFVITVAPTEAPATQPPATPAPGATPISGATATIAPPAGATPATTAAPPVLRLTKEADHTVVWPGLDVTFTLVVTNGGATSVRNVVVEDALPPELIPGEILGQAAAWDGRTLRARTAVLAPSGRLVLTFTARVRADLAAGGIILNQAAATAAGGQRATAGLVLVLPPAELPPTGAQQPGP